MMNNLFRDASESSPASLIRIIPDPPSSGLREISDRIDRLVELIEVVAPMRDGQMGIHVETINSVLRNKPHYAAPMHITLTRLRDHIEAEFAELSWELMILSHREKQYHDSSNKPAELFEYLWRVSNAYLTRK